MLVRCYKILKLLKNFNKKKPAVTERALPPAFKNIVQLSFNRTLTDEEREKIAKGANLVLNLLILTEHKPGKMGPTMDLFLTNPESNGTSEFPTEPTPDATPGDVTSVSQIEDQPLTHFPSGPSA